MKNQKLHDELQKLRNEIEHLAVDDTESRKKLEQLLVDIEAKLENPDNGDSSLIDHLKDAIEHFETEHPRATAIMNDIMVALSNMGI